MNRIFSIALICAAALSLNGCYEMEDTIANVYVVRDFDGEEQPVDAAYVRLYAVGDGSDPRFDVTEQTTAEGFASFNFSEFYVAGQAGFAVLDVEVWRGTGASQLTGTGLIKIVEMQTNEVTITVE